MATPAEIASVLMAHSVTLAGRVPVGAVHSMQRGARAIRDLVRQVEALERAAEHRFRRDHNDHEL